MKKIKMKVYKTIKNKYFWLVLLAIYTVPVIVNLTVFQFSTPITFKGDWLSFWGNYSGGILSAVVAYFVANSQIKKQQRLELAKDRYARTINQLPALIRIELELTRIIKEIKKAQEQREMFTIAMQSEGKHDDEDEETKEQLVEYEANLKQYNIELFNDEYFNLIELVEDIDLHIDLITCFQFYKDFSFAVAKDLLPLESKKEKLSEELVETYVAGSDTWDENIIRESNQINLQIIDSQEKKDNAWHKYFDDEMQTKIIDLHNRVKSEIEITVRVKDEGFISNK